LLTRNVVFYPNTRPTLRLYQIQPGLVPPLFITANTGSWCTKTISRWFNIITPRNPPSFFLFEHTCTMRAHTHTHPTYALIYVMYIRYIRATYGQHSPLCPNRYTIIYSTYIYIYIKCIDFKARLGFPISNITGETTSYNKIRFQLPRQKWWKTKTTTKKLPRIDFNNWSRGYFTTPAGIHLGTYLVS